MVLLWSGTLDHLPGYLATLLSSVYRTGMREGGPHIGDSCSRKLRPKQQVSTKKDHFLHIKNKSGRTNMIDIGLPPTNGIILKSTMMSLSLLVAFHAGRITS